MNNQIRKAQNITPLAPNLTYGKLAQDAPHSTMLEEIVLACCFSYPSFVHKLMASVGDNQIFYWLRHQWIYEAICEVAGNGSEADSLLAIEVLLGNGRLKDIGGPAYITKLITDYQKTRTGPPDLDGYIKQLKGYHARWELLRAADEITKQAYDMEAIPSQVLHKSQNKLSTIGEFIHDELFTPLSVEVQRLADRIEETKDSDKLLLPTGIKSVDDIVDGLQRGKVCVVAGRPHHAKTSVSLSVALNVAKLGQRVAIFNVADGNKSDVLSRLIAMEGGVNYSGVATANIHEKQHGRYIEAMSKLHNLKISIQSQKGMTMPELQAQARAIAGVDGLDLIVIDYIQRLTVDTSAPGAPRDLYSQQAHISQSITKIAEQLNVPIIVAAQINRAGNSKMPDVSHIKGCGNIEEDADLVWIVYRDWLDDPTHPRPQQIRLKIGKNKINGKLGEALLNINSQSTYVDSQKPLGR